MKLRKWEIAYLLFAAVTGSLLHFLFEWSGGNSVLALVSPVNESTWEHLKLLFFPTLLFSAVEFFAVRKESPGFLIARFFALLAGMGTIVAVFYTYSGILGTNFLAADILTFLAGVVVTSCCTRRWTYRMPKMNGAAWAGLLLLCLAFFSFAFWPPQIGMFLDPVTGGYGLPM